MKRSLQWGVALLLSGAGLWFALRGADPQAMQESVRRIHAPYGLLLIPLVVFVEFSLRAWRWKILLAPLRRAPFKTLWFITAAGFFLNNVLPFRVGELARVYWTRQKTGAPFAAGLAVLAGDRVLDMLCLLTLTGLVLSQKTGLLASASAVWTFGAITVAGLAVLGFVARLPQPLKKRLENSAALKPLTSRLIHFVEGAAALKSPWTLLKAYVVSLLFWSIDVSFLMALGRLFSLPLSWLDGAWLLVAMCFGAALPSAPGYVGTLEAAGVAALGLIGYDRNLTLPFILILHFGQILSTALWGVPSLWTAGLSWKKAENP